MLLLALGRAAGQHYCWPCASPHGVVGKDTHASSGPVKCYDFYLKYLNNVVPGLHNSGDGFHTFNIPKLGDVQEAWDVPPNNLAAEVNECGTLVMDWIQGTIGGMSDADRKNVADGLRLPTGKKHQCPCAVTGRAHIVNGTLANVHNFDAVEKSWGKEYTEMARSTAENMAKRIATGVDPTEMANEHGGRIFGVHSVYCPFHASGPCKLDDVERGVSAAWANNFSRGYVPLMDTNMMYWTSTLGPLLNALVRDGVSFYPMVWTAAATASSPQHDIYSVLVSPCGKQLIEVASSSSGGRSRGLFHEMEIPRAVFDSWNEPSDPALQPLVPLRMSRAVPADRLSRVLDFYGVGKKADDARKLGFGQSRILANVTDGHGTTALTLMLSPNATVHLQLWVRPEEEPTAGPQFPAMNDFRAAASSNQVNGGQPASAQGFCSSGTWTVKRYSDYILNVHETVMTPVPAAGSNPLMPPAGSIMDVFLDDHMSWDCTAPECDVVHGGEALYNFGSRIMWFNAGSLGAGLSWTPYSYDPAGYGIELHWFFSSKGFKPQGTPAPACFNAYKSNGTCAGSFLHSELVV